MHCFLSAHDCWWSFTDKRAFGVGLELTPALELRYAL